MGIRIDGATDLINATDGSLTIEGQSVNTTGIMTASGGIKVGSAATIHSTGQFNIGVAATIFANGNATFSGIATVGGNVNIAQGTGQAHYQITQASGNTVKFGIVSGSDIELSGTSNNSMYFKTNNTERFRITGAGLVGINDTSPEELLDLGESNQQNLKLGQRGYLGQGYSTGATILGHSVKAKTSGTTIAGMEVTESNSGGGAPSAIRLQNGNIEFHTAASGTSGATFNSERLRIDESGHLNIVGVTTAAAFVPSMGQLSNRNLIINGNCSIAQRGTSSTSADFASVDRWRFRRENISAGTCTQSQQALSSSDSPWNEGHRYYGRLALGQAGTAASNAEVAINQKIESQDMASSGWQYTSTSSYITISFWMRASTNQTFNLYLYNEDSGYKYPVTFTASGNNTWTKITKTIPGNSNLVFNNDTGSGLQVMFMLFYGSGYTNNASNATWASYSGTNFVADMASTWLTAGASTFDFTGVQLEVGEYVTPYEHRQKHEELNRCKRYFQDWTDRQFFANRTADSSYDGHVVLGMFDLNMRANPTVSPNVVYGRQAGESGWTNGDNNEAAGVHHDPSSTFPGRWFLLTGTWNWHSGYNDTIAVKFHSVNFSAEL